jgi:hypothetical protein
MAWLSERPALASTRKATDILSEIAQLIGKAANPSSPVRKNCGRCPVRFHIEE